MLGWPVNVTTLFLGRLRPPKQLTNTLCTYFCQELTTALLESAEEETNMWPDRVLNPGPLALEPDMLPTTPHSLALSEGADADKTPADGQFVKCTCLKVM